MLHEGSRYRNQIWLLLGGGRSFSDCENRPEDFTVLRFLLYAFFWGHVSHFLFFMYNRSLMEGLEGTAGDGYKIQFNYFSNDSNHVVRVFRYIVGEGGLNCCKQLLSPGSS